MSMSVSWTSSPVAYQPTMSSLGNTCLSAWKQVEKLSDSTATGCLKAKISWHSALFILGGAAAVSEHKPTLLSFLGQQTLINDQA